MNGKIRRRIEMGFRALQFSYENPDPSPSYGVMVARLEDLMRQAGELELRQLKGRNQEGGAAKKKRVLRRTMKRAHLAYLARLAEAASNEEPELGQLFAWPRSRAQRDFRATAGKIAAQAVERRELLERFGLSAEVLEALGDMLKDFDRFTEELIEGQRMHVGATAGLRQVSAEILQAVSVLDGFNRVRFAGHPSALVVWASVSKVLAHSARAAGDAPAEEEGGVRPAA